MPSHTVEYIATALFTMAILHTFCTSFFERLAHDRPKHAGLWHLLGEVEVVFGFWACILIALIFIVDGNQIAVTYMDSRNFTEPMFVFAIMVIAGTRPILQAATYLVGQLSRLFPSPAIGFYFMLLSIVPLLGSFITEPAAMTLAALLLRERIFKHTSHQSLKYATLGVLLVNISIGGTLTAFAAPPVLMVAKTWAWDNLFMLKTFGWKAAIAVFINAIGISIYFRNELRKLSVPHPNTLQQNHIPLLLTVLHGLFLAGVVFFSHHPSMFMGLFLLFLGVAHAYQRYQDRLILREGLLVALFLAGLVVLGGLQQWWLQAVLLKMNASIVFFGALFLTAFTDNAALTYLGSLVTGLSEHFKYSLVAGAVTGGGLTVIANAPNPIGISILSPHMKDQHVKATKLLYAALLPTTIAACLFFLF